MTQLPEAEWRDHSGLKRVVAALTDGERRPLAVGGAVRDSLLGLDVSDVDLATHLLPQEVIQRLEAADINAIPTGIEHGTITAVADSRNYEITTFRRDVATDGRRATVAFSDDWREDAQRRDFTINALYADVKSGEILDSVGGIADLEKRHIRFIGPASERIAEDHLRILRYFRFLARFGKSEVDDEAVEACQAAAMSLKSLSRERIAGELTRLLTLPNPRIAVSLMQQNSIFTAFLPEVTEDASQRLSALIDREAEHDQPISLEARLLSILPSGGVVIDKLARRLKLSNRMRKSLLARLPDRDYASAEIRELAYSADMEVARDYAMLHQSDEELADSLTQLKGWNPPDFPLTGGMLIEKGISAGPLVAKTLQSIERKWMEEGFPDETRLQAITDQLVSEALSEDTA